jgi:hypothetical protein
VNVACFRSTKDSHPTFIFITVTEKDGPFVRIKLPDEIGPHPLEMPRKRALDLWQATHGDENLEDAKVFDLP